MHGSFGHGPGSPRRLNEPLSSPVSHRGVPNQILRLDGSGYYIQLYRARIQLIDFDEFARAAGWTERLSLENPEFRPPS
jgi:hypothetical protein